MRALSRLAALFLAVFLVPLVLAAGWWLQADRPHSWRAADWGPTGILPAASAYPDAAIYVMAARTGGIKGAFSVHSWVVIKEAGGAYERFEKVGWGEPIRRNAYAPDAKWYSNVPFILHGVTGEQATKLIPKIRDAISAYPYGNRGDYRIWPGPNSNTFIAHILRNVSALAVTLPANAVGKDYLGRRILAFDASGMNLVVSIGGLGGFAIGGRSGLQLHFFGQSIGLTLQNPAVQLPGVGQIPIY